MAVLHHGTYIPTEVYLAELPSSVTEIPVDLPASLPSDTTEVLVYLFVTAKAADNPFRSYYEIYTKDDNGLLYKQYMNVAMATDDFTLNSANIWLPVFSERKFYIRIPDEFELPRIVASRSPKRKFKAIRDTIEALKNPDGMVSGSFLTGYRTKSLSR